MAKLSYCTEQSENKHWWYTIAYDKTDPEGHIVGERFACKRRAMDQTTEYRRVKGNADTHISAHGSAVS